MQYARTKCTPASLTIAALSAETAEALVILSLTVALLLLAIISVRLLTYSIAVSLSSSSD
jgi:hypothetical protein